MERNLSLVLKTDSSTHAKVSIPKKAIPLENAVTYYNNFYNTRSESTRAVWFEFKMLENYFDKVNQFCEDCNVEITRFAFLFGADKNAQRTVFIAPVTYDERLDLHRAFSFDNGKITYLHRFAGENYSTINDFTQLQSLDQSLILSDSGTISSAQAISLYNNYYDSVTAPFSDTVKLDTRFVYYEKGEFEGYLDFLKKQATKSNIELSGVNFVFSAIDDSPDEGVYANHLTLFFAPTKDGIKHISFSSFDRPEENLLDFSKATWYIDIDSAKKIQLTTMFNRTQSGPPPIDWD